MFGTYRYILALMVVVSHLAPIYMVHVGFYSVFGFFTLSGYLMSMILHTTYYKLPSGFERYTLNRLLRVLPSYWVVLLISAIITFYYPDISLKIHERMQWPESGRDWIANLFVVGLTSLDGVRSTHNLVPPTWSLSVEIVLWVFMAFMVKTRLRLYIWGTVAIGYQILLMHFFQYPPLQVRYYSHFAALLPFFAGAVLYMLMKHKAAIAPIWGVVFITLSIGYYLLAPLLFGAPEYSSENWDTFPVLNSGLYLAILINILTIYILSKIDINAVPGKLAKIDNFLGNLSYPIFLSHIFAAIVLVVIFDNNCATAICGRSWQLTLITFPLVNVLALLLWFCVEKPLAAIRERVKKKC